MNVAVIGASGFVGKAVVRQALGLGWRVTAVARHAVRDMRDLAGTGLVAIDADVTNPGSLPDWSGIDAVVYAVGMSRLEDGRAAIGNVLDGMTGNGAPRLVAVGSLSVIDYGAIAEDSVVVEASPVVADFTDRDEYARIKADEETQSIGWAKRGGRLSIVRLGAVIGPGRVWTARLGFRFGTRWVHVDSGASLPIVQVDDAGEVIANVVAAGEAPRVLHVVHGQEVMQRRYVEMIVERGMLSRPALRIPARVLRRALGVAGRLSPISVARFDARFKRVRFSAEPALGYCLGLSRRPEEVLERCAGSR